MKKFYKNKKVMAMDLTVGDVVNGDAVVTKVKTATVETSRGVIYIFGNNRGEEVLRTMSRGGVLRYEAVVGGNNNSTGIKN